MSSSPGRPVPSTGRRRKPHCNRRAGSRAGEGAFLGCLRAESPPATAATHTRSHTQRHATATHHSVPPKHAGTQAKWPRVWIHAHAATCTCRSTQHGHGPARRDTHGDTRRDAQTHTQHSWGHMCGDARTQQHTRRDTGRAAAVHVWARAVTHAALTTQRHNMHSQGPWAHRHAHTCTHTHTHMHTHAHTCTHTCTWGVQARATQQMPSCSTAKG